MKNKTAGFTLLEIIIALAALGGLTVLVAKNSGFLTNMIDVVKGVSSREKLIAAAASLSQLAVDVDEDGYYELPVPGTGDTLPAGVIGTVDDYGTPFKYCGFDLGIKNTVDANYVSNAAGYDATHPSAIIISAGRDKVFQTTCDDTEAKGDDVIWKIYESDLRYAMGGIGGMKHVAGEVSLITPTDNVNFNTSLVTLGHFGSLPTTDPYGNAVKVGTIAYQTGTSTYGNEGVYIWNGTTWKPLGGCPEGYMLKNGKCIQWPYTPVPGQCVRANGTLGTITFHYNNTQYGGLQCNSTVYATTNSGVGCGCSDSDSYISISGLVSCVGSNTMISTDPNNPSCVNPDMTYGQLKVVTMRSAFWLSGDNRVGYFATGLFPANTAWSEGTSSMRMSWSCQ